MTEHHITDPEPQEQDLAVEQTLRPGTFDEFIGQEEVVENLKLYIEACRRRNDALDHVLLFGPPGLGKTTLAHIIARELDVNLRHTSGPVLERAADLAGLLTNLRSRDVLFIDEIHRMNNVVEEYLYGAMEDFRIDIMIDRGPSARSVRLNLEKFTLIGATTRMGSLTSPMRDRFGVVLRVDFYTDEALFKIIQRSAKILGIEIDREAALELARRSRGTPRVCNRILRRTQDYAEVKADGKISRKVASESLQKLGIDSHGLDEFDRRILTVLVEKFQGGPVGINSLSVALGEDPQTIEDVYEPYLIKEGFIQRTSRGRIAQDLTFSYLHVEKPERQGNLF
ncbi:MAG: Holliday junction branch migration DNA helicase RuvB [Fidelibacterota bacterium]